MSLCVAAASSERAGEREREGRVDEIQRSFQCATLGRAPQRAGSVAFFASSLRAATDDAVPSALTNEAAARPAKWRDCSTTAGSPAHSVSAPVVCALYIRLSTHTSASARNER